MVKRRRRSDAPVDGVPVKAPTATLGSLPGSSLLDLPAALLDDVARRSIQLGAGGALSLTCRSLSKTNLLHAPALLIQLDSQRCDQFLTPRVGAALQFRTCKLALSLQRQQAQDSRQYLSLLTKVLKKLGSCAAVEACKLGTVQGPSLGPFKRLHCSLGLAQHLMDSFPSLTSLSLHNCATPCSGLASLLAHPRMSLQLQQLDLSSTTILKPERSEPGAATLANLFHASRLKQLSLLINGVTSWGALLPDLQPLSQHLTQLCIRQEVHVQACLHVFSATLQPLAQLQVLAISNLYNLSSLPSLLQALPQLHTLHLPCATVEGQEQLDALLAATQLTSIQLSSVKGLTSSRADVPCSWQRLELRGYVCCPSVAHLPLQSLTQPLQLGRLLIRTDQGHHCDLVAAAVHNLTQACSVLVRITSLQLGMYMSEVDAAAQRHVDLQQLVAVLQALKHCSKGSVHIAHRNVGVADVATLSPVCQGCTQLNFWCGNVTPSLEFWRQLVQLMPTVTNVVFEHVEGSTSSAMHQSLQLMAEQPWARWLDICITPLDIRKKPRSAIDQRLPACWRASPLSHPGKLRVWMKDLNGCIMNA